jgi:hypothetical protein
MKVYTGINAPVKSNSWQSIFEWFDKYRPGMARFVAWLKASEFADGLFAVTSLDTLIIGQSSMFDMNRSVIRINEINGRFLIVFQEDYCNRSEREVQESDLIEAFRRLIFALH